MAGILRAYGKILKLSVGLFNFMTSKKKFSLSEDNDIFA